MLKPMLTLAAVAQTVAGPTAQTSNAAATATLVPARFQGVWGKNGRCDIAASRLRITARRAGWGTGPFKPVVYSADGDTVKWDDEYDAATFAIGGRPDILVYNKEGGNMPAGREGYARCGAELKRVAWPRP